MSKAATVLHILTSLGFAAVVVVVPYLLNLGLLALWTALVHRWLKQGLMAKEWRASAIETLFHSGIMASMLVAAVLAPVKTVDKLKARHFNMPREELSIAELRNPSESGLTRAITYRISATEDLNDRVIRFPSSTPTVEEFIAAIEAQTPLRHRFSHCGNGSSILWGGDCSFGLSFSDPRG